MPSFLNDEDLQVEGIGIVKIEEDLEAKVMRFYFGDWRFEFHPNDYDRLVVLLQTLHYMKAYTRDTQLNATLEAIILSVHSRFLPFL